MKKSKWEVVGIYEPRPNLYEWKGVDEKIHIIPGRMHGGGTVIIIDPKKWEKKQP